MHTKLLADELLAMAISNNEVVELQNGSICSVTSPHTGRSPKAKFYVRDEVTEKKIDWLNNESITPDTFKDRLKAYQAYADKNCETHFQSVAAVRDPRYQIQVDIFCERAKHALFSRNMFITDFNPKDVKDKYTIYHFPSITKQPEVLVSIKDRTILISGTSYAGEIKKSIFSVLNYHFPESGCLPMHCSVNVDSSYKEPTIFFGLSGTGKTTLSSDPNRILVGDDEHCWTENGLTNFEGGCYAKTVRLSEKDEPQIYRASTKKYSILENVVVKNLEPDFDDTSITENGRASYPSSNIEGAHPAGYVDEHPKNIVMLTCDAFGVLPAVSILNPDDAVAQFKMGYTAKVAGTESGVSRPVATFSPCFGGPFMPLPTNVYADLLMKKIADHDCKCWLVNTGWTGGPYGVGTRIPLAVTRLIIDKILDGSLQKCESFVHVHTGFRVPNSDLIDSKFLKPETSWDNLCDYQEKVLYLLHHFKVILAPDLPL